LDDDKVRDEFDRRAARQRSIHAVLDAQEAPAVLRGNLLRDRVTRSAALRIVAPRATEAILDLGCGVGRLSFPLGERAGSVIGVDVAANMITVARELMAGHPGARVEFRHAPALPLPVEEGSIDKAIACWVLAHMSDDRLRSTVGDVRRCLRPGGWFFAFEQMRDQPREMGSIHSQRSLAEYEGLFSAAGFDLLGHRKVMRSPSYALGMWNRLQWLPAAALPLLDGLERLTVGRKPALADYVTIACSFRRRS
jgi:SAM-dependent methyltransferase